MDFTLFINPLSHSLHTHTHTHTHTHRARVTDAALWTGGEASSARHALWGMFVRRGEGFGGFAGCGACQRVPHLAPSRSGVPAWRGDRGTTDRIPGEECCMWGVRATGQHRRAAKQIQDAWDLHPGGRDRQTKNPTHMSLPATWWLSFILVGGKQCLNGANDVIVEDSWGLK